MKALKEILEEQVTKMKESKFYRFRLYIKENDMKKTVGMAYLKEGQNIYTLRELSSFKGPVVSMKSPPLI